MQNARLFMLGAIVGLCLCATAKADDDEFPFPTAARPVVVRRVIVVTRHQDRVIYVRPADHVRTVVPVNRSAYLNSANQTHDRNGEMSGSNVRDSDNHVIRPAKTGREVDANQSKQQADKDSKPLAHKPEVTQHEAKQQEPTEPEDGGALDRLTVQAQKEQEIHLAEPAGIEPR